MNLNDDQLRQFKTMWKNETGEEIDSDTAREYALNIITLVESVLEGQKQHKRIRDPPKL